MKETELFLLQLNQSLRHVSIVNHIQHFRVDQNIALVATLPRATSRSRDQLVGYGEKRKKPPHAEISPFQLGATANSQTWFQIWSSGGIWGSECECAYCRVVLCYCVKTGCCCGILFSIFLLQPANCKYKSQHIVVKFNYPSGPRQERTRP